MEQTIHQAEETLKRLTEESLLPANATNAKALNEITAKMAEAQAEIDRLYQRWAELEQ